RNDRVYLRNVTASEQVNVYQQRIQIINIKAFIVTRHHRKGFLITFIKLIFKPPKQSCHGQVNFTVPIINSWIYQTRITVLVDNEITVPQITMKQRRFFCVED